MEPIEAYYKIREACLRRPELRFKGGENFDSTMDYELNLKPYQGFCHVATQVFCNLVPGAKAYGRDGHYFAKIGEHVWDLTAEQFDYIFRYGGATHVRLGKGRLTKRAQLLLDEVML
jgi:hypothetical protein